MRADDLFEEESEGRKAKEISLFKHFGYYTINGIKQFFSGPYKEEKRELNVLDSIRTLLESEPTEENINKCQELSTLHRMVENTRARRRL